MKSITRYLSFLLVLVASTGAIAEAGLEATLGKETHEDYRFSFKTEKKFIGASVEIYHATGERLVTQTLERRKVIIDFGKARKGEYTIRIKTGDQLIEEYKYVKK